jgi:hypothetical protein
MNANEFNWKGIVHFFWRRDQGGGNEDTYSEDGSLGFSVYGGGHVVEL